MSKGSSIHVENERDDRATLLVDDRLPLCSTLASNSMLAPVESEDGGGWLGVEAPLIEEDGSVSLITFSQIVSDCRCFTDRSIEGQSANKLDCAATAHYRSTALR